MPVHDWTRVSAGTFHDFHTVWIAELRQSLNGGVLPEGYYAQAEQVASQIIPDVLTLQESSVFEDIAAAAGGKPSNDGTTGGLAIADVPPRVALKDTVSEAMLLATRRRRLVIRHASGDRIVALLEIVSPGNKERLGALDMFVDKVIGAFDEGYHLLLIDLFPPGKFDPAGMHGAVWQRMGGRYTPPAGKPLTLASYVVAGAVTSFVEPTAVATTLVPMPLFLDPGHYVNVPLEQTYMSAYRGVPRRWKAVIEATAGIPES